MTTSPRVEIPKKVKLAVFSRAGGPGDPRCEGSNCGLPVKGRAFEYHHEFPEWLQQIPPSQRDPITPEAVKLLCKPCHDAISARDTTSRAHGKRIVEKAAKAKKAKGRPMPGSKASGFKKTMDGRVIRREK